MTTESKSLEDLRAELSAEPGSPEFVGLARRLNSEEKTRPEAREVCLRGLNADPSNFSGRLLLAQSYYLDGLGEFCVRELVELRKRCDAPSLDRLLDAFGEYAAPFRSAVVRAAPAPETSKEDGVVAEFELDAEFSEALDELDGE